MPIMIQNPDLEKRLAEHARRLPVPSTKAELIRGIASAVLDAAEAEQVDAGELLSSLRARSRGRKAPAAA